jgi:hypothetical protein
MSASTDTGLRQARQAILDAHSAAETAHDLDGVIATFHHPRYEEDRLVCERVYYDLLTVLRGLGVARDPDSPAGQATMLLNHPLHLGRTFGRELLRRRRH